MLRFALCAAVCLALVGCSADEKPGVAVEKRTVLALRDGRYAYLHDNGRWYWYSRTQVESAPRAAVSPPYPSGGGWTQGRAPSDVEMKDVTSLPDARIELDPGGAPAAPRDAGKKP